MWVNSTCNKTIWLQLWQWFQVHFLCHVMYVNYVFIHSCSLHWHYFTLIMFYLECYQKNITNVLWRYKPLKKSGIAHFYLFTYSLNAIQNLMKLDTHRQQVILRMHTKWLHHLSILKTCHNSATVWSRKIQFGCHLLQDKC